MVTYSYVNVKLTQIQNYVFILLRSIKFDEKVNSFLKYHMHTAFKLRYEPYYLLRK